MVLRHELTYVCSVISLCSGTQERTEGLARPVFGLLCFPAHSPPHSSSWVLEALFAEASEPLIPNSNYLREG